LKLGTRWLIAAGISALAGYLAIEPVYYRVRWNGTLLGMNIPWQKAHEAGWVVAFLVTLLVFWPTLRTVEWAEWRYAPAWRRYAPTRREATTMGIVAGIISGVAIGFLTLLGPVLIDPQYALIWFWFSWAIAPPVGIGFGVLVGWLVYRGMSRRAAQAGATARGETCHPELRDL
jgi:hypothetical protein